MRGGSKNWLLAVGVAGLVATGCAGDRGEEGFDSLPRPVVAAPSSTVPALPRDAIRVAPSIDLVQLVETSPAASVFVLEAGVHRLTGTLIPKDGQQFFGEQGAIVSGAGLVSGFERVGRRWRVRLAKDLPHGSHGTCQESRPACALQLQLFLDDRRVELAGSVDVMDTGQWAYDPAERTVWIGFDPEGGVVEASMVERAFGGTAADVVITGLTIEKFANQAQLGAVDSRDEPFVLEGGVAWRVANNVIRWNHGIGVSLTDRGLISGNVIYENGQLGVAAHGRDVSVRDNEIFGNNTAGFESAWEAGGGKFTYTSGLVVESNFVHDNAGHGLWTDLDAIDTTYRNNVVWDNDHAGIFHEISYAAVIEGNDVRGNGDAYNEWLWGAGIQIAGSRDVEVTGNTVVGNANGVVAIEQGRADAPATHGPLSLSNVLVRNNTIVGNRGVTGVAQDIGSPSVYTERNIVFVDNTYSEDARFHWLDEERSEREWRSFGLG